MDSDTLKSLKLVSPCEGNFTICPMLLADVDEALTLLTTIYARDEPLSSFLGLEAHDLYDFLHQSFVDGIEHGMSFVAKDEDQKIIGTARALDFLREREFWKGIRTPTPKDSVRYFSGIGSELRSKDATLLSSVV